MLVAVALVGAAAAALGWIVPMLQPRVGSLGEPPLTKAGVDVRAIHDVAKLYRHRNGAWPTLEQLTTPDERGKAYIEELTQDPWGHDYLLREVEGGTLVVLSRGPDGVDGTADDLTSVERRL